MSAWVLPDHIADVLPSQARLVEDLRRALLDTARSYGYELVIPPLVEHIESLLTGTGKTLDLQTFKLVDLLSGRTLGVRADTTQQTARIDAHLLNRQGTTRLCYCGSVLHTRPEEPNATREPLQFGAELYGCSDHAADIEVVSLALHALHNTGAANALKPSASNQPQIVLDLADARIVPALLAQVPNAQIDLNKLQQALITKNRDAIIEAATPLPQSVTDTLLALTDMYGAIDVLQAAKKQLPNLPPIAAAIDDLTQLAQYIHTTYPHVQVQFDLADSQGYSYYSGMRFAIYLTSNSDAVVRGGRYDKVGAAFGRKRPAVGFSLDVKALAQYSPERALRTAIRAVWNASPQWQQAVQQLRNQGETVLVTLPGEPPAPDEFLCDKVLTEQNGKWLVQAT